MNIYGKGMFDLDINKMGYTILYRNEKSFFGNAIEKEQLRRGMHKDAACFTHVEVSGGGNLSVNIAPPTVRICDIKKEHKGRYIKLMRYNGNDYENHKRYKIAFSAIS